MRPKNRATNLHYSRFGTISDGTITGIHCNTLMLPLSPDSQVVLSGLHERRNFASVSTEFSHQWRVLRITIPHLNIVWWCSIAIDIHCDEGYVDKCSIGLWDEKDTVFHSLILIRVWWGSQNATWIWEASSTFSKYVKDIILNLKSLSSNIIIRDESEMILIMRLIFVTCLCLCQKLLLTL